MKIPSRVINHNRVLIPDTHNLSIFVIKLDNIIGDAASDRLFIAFKEMTDLEELVLYGEFPIVGDAPAYLLDILQL